MQSGWAASRQQKWSNSGNWEHGFSGNWHIRVNYIANLKDCSWGCNSPTFSRIRSWDLTESWTSSSRRQAVATKSNLGPLQTNNIMYLNLVIEFCWRWERNNMYSSLLLLAEGSFRAAANLRPSVRVMEVCSDFWSFRGVLAIDKSSCSMHEYTSSFKLKSFGAELLINKTITKSNLDNYHTLPANLNNINNQSPLETPISSVQKFPFQLKRLNCRKQVGRLSRSNLNQW